MVASVPKELLTLMNALRFNRTGTSPPPQLSAISVYQPTPKNIRHPVAGAWFSFGIAIYILPNIGAI